MHTKQEVFEKVLNLYAHYAKGYIWEVSGSIEEDEADLESDINKWRQEWGRAE